MAVEWQVGCDLAVQTGHFWRLRSGGKGGLGEVVAALDADGQVMPSWLAGPGLRRHGRVHDSGRTARMTA
jgi:hypothetical protein